MKQVPSTIVLSILFLILAAWPSVQAWGEFNLFHHLAVHMSYVVAGALFGLQTAWWMSKPIAGYVGAEESGVSS